MGGFGERKDVKGKERDDESEGGAKAVEESAPEKKEQSERVTEMIVLADKMTVHGTQALSKEQYQLLAQKYDDLKDVEKLMARSMLIQHGHPQIEEGLRGGGYQSCAKPADEANSGKETDRQKAEKQRQESEREEERTKTAKSDQEAKRDEKGEREAEKAAETALQPAAAS